MPGGGRWKGRQKGDRFCPKGRLLSSWPQGSTKIRLAAKRCKPGAPAGGGRETSFHAGGPVADVLPQSLSVCLQHRFLQSVTVSYASSIFMSPFRPLFLRG